MALGLVEPLRELFKDEVRRIGLELGLPSELIHRHPFPGPGLGVRVLGEVKAEYLDILRQADHIYIEELNKHDLYQRVAQAFVVFMPVKSVGVVGDARQYEYVVALRAVETTDFMTATCANLPFDFLTTVLGICYGMHAMASHLRSPRSQSRRSQRRHGPSQKRSFQPPPTIPRRTISNPSQ